MSKIQFYIVASLFVLACSCKKENTGNITENIIYEEVNNNPPLNPYAVLVDTLTIVDDDQYPPNSLVYIHNTIFEPTCASPGCHDGHFEPDFRTPQSTFNTLVYHEIVKNNASESFDYRVIPYDTANSVLHERITNCCFANVNDRMPQDNIGEPLPEEDILNISNWILNGAPDMFGVIATQPDKRPNLSPYYYATNNTYTINYSSEQNREAGIIYNPFILPLGEQLNIIVQVDDDITATPNLLVNQLKISNEINDFSNALTYSGVYFNGNDGEFYLISIDGSTLPSNEQLYMRYYVNDGTNASNVEFPKDDVFTEYKTYWSFIVQ